MDKAPTPYSRRLLKIALGIAGATALLLATAFLILNALFPLPFDRLNPSYSTEVVDRQGRLLRTYLADDEMWRFKVQVGDVSPNLLDVVRINEDRWFYWHPGFNPVSILKAALRNRQAGVIVRGASTITMQVARLAEPKERTLTNKIMELFRALQMEICFTKKEILTFYLNLAPYGGNIVGIQAAARLYFGKEAAELTLGEAAILAAIPQNPNDMRPDIPETNIVEGRNRVLARLLRSRTITQHQLNEALQETLPSSRKDLPLHALHVADYLHQRYPEYTSIRTTIDLSTQKMVESLLQDKVERLHWRGIYNGAAIVVDPRTSEVLAMVGSPDWYDDDHSGQVNGVFARRAPGSTLKPLAYGLALDLGLVTPQQLLLDVPVNYQGYTPQNYDGEFSGAVPARTALANSLNVPAVNLVAEIGLERFYRFLRSCGVQSLDQPPEHYGLSLILGGGDVSLFELVGLYTGLANLGEFGPLHFLLDHAQVPKQPLLNNGSAYIIAEILTDVTRPDLPSIWQSVVDMPTVAWKTGTSYGRRDAWAIGYSPQLVAGVWIGNFDSTPVAELNGANTAGPILFSILKRLHDPQGHNWYMQPRNLARRQVCAMSGLLPEDGCGTLISDYSIPGISSAARCNIHHIIVIDESEQLELCSLCRNVHNWKFKTITEYPAEIERWFTLDKSANIRPPHNPDCIRFSKGEKPVLLSPQHKAEYWINPGLALEDQLIAFRAAAFSDVDSLFWFVSGEMVSKCHAGEASFWPPYAGNHLITCMDDKGRYSVASIMIR